MLSIKQSLSEGGLRWIPTDAQMADGMTKISTDLMMKVATFMGQCIVQLTADTQASRIRYTNRGGIADRLWPLSYAEETRQS